MGTADDEQHGRRGHVFVMSKDGSVAMNVNEHGGRVEIFGKGDGTSRAIMGVNEYGDGAVSAWDKNWYRKANLK